MKSKGKFTSRFNSILIPALIGCVAALPQTADSQETGTNHVDSPTNDPARLPAVTVVAQKEPQEAANLPVSVTAVTRETLDNAGVQSVKDASVYAPNTFINEFTARALSNPFFRGVGGSPLNPGVTTFIDGVPQLNSYSSSIELLDVDQIEFVRGPQGALFGRNTAGGLINITSRRPADLWTGSAEGSFGNYSFHDVRGTVSGPIAKDELAMSLSAGYSGRNGYTVNDFNGQDVDHREGEFGKGQLLYKISDRLEMRFIAFGEHDHDGDYALGDLNYIRANPNHVDYDFTGGFNHRDVASGTFLINYFGESVDAASISGGVWWKNENLTDLDYTPTPGSLYDNTEEQHQFTQEFRLSSAKDKPIRLGDNLELSWQSGVFLFTQDYLKAVTNTQPAGPFFPGFSAFSQANADLDDWGVGVYGQTKLTAWEKLDFTAGLRFDYEDKRGDLNNALNFTPFAFPPFLVPSTASVNVSDHFSEVSPQFGLAWHCTSNDMVYASIARGYKAGGFNPPPVGVPAPVGSEEYGSEHSWNYELGYKGRWLDDKLETTLALFYIDWRNLQLNQAVAGGQGQFFVGNAGGADSKGVEFNVLYRPMAGWDLFGGVGYSDARFLGGSTAFNGNTGINQDVSGNRLPFAPSVTGNAGTQVYWSPCSHATLYARAEVTVTGEFEYDASNAQAQETYSVANFRAGVRGGHWFAEGWVNNAFDQHYVPIAIQYGTPSGYVGESGAPLTFGARLGLTF